MLSIENIISNNYNFVNSLLARDISKFDILLLSMGKLGSYIESELQSRGWTQADLARESGLNTSVISNLINGNRKLGLSSLLGFVKAFGVSADKILREAGLLPPVPERTEAHEQVLHLWDQLSATDRQVVLDLMEVLNTKKR